MLATVISTSREITKKEPSRLKQQRSISAETSRRKSIRKTQNVITDTNKSKISVFLSFEFGRDNELHRNFYAQAEHHSQYEIIDCSLKEPYHPDSRWLEKARKQITLSDIVIVVVGGDTHNAPGVEKEVTVANQLKNRCFRFDLSEGQRVKFAVLVK